MRAHIIFPEGLTEFLYWVKATTESAWSKLAVDVPMYGAKWLGLSDQEIDGLELRYAIKFGNEHRAFLRILHTMDKNYPDPEEEKMGNRPSFFYNWITDTSWIERRLNWPYDTILDDILRVNHVWLKSWGQRPVSDEETTKAFAAWYNEAPRLLPVTAHTFLMADAGAGLRPLLSVCGTDTIVMAWSLRHYLMRTFARELDLREMVLDKEDGCYYAQMVTGIPELDSLETIRQEDADIPYWKEMITYWLPRWQGFRVS
jgi:hypothetical protein